MKLFQCDRCFHLIFFENVVCENCGSSVGYLSTQNTFSAIDARGGAWQAGADSEKLYRYCRNHEYGACNWLVPAAGKKKRCLACDLNRTIPDLNREGNLRSWQHLEVAKHRLVYSILRFGLPLQNKSESPDTGLAFDFLSDESVNQDQKGIFTGHVQGFITINVAEADSAYREQTREQMAEPYRTLIGHFRHEIGHYYWEQLVNRNEVYLQKFRDLFGDERDDYAERLHQYHRAGAPDNWREQFVSAYASAHPWEAWAETWAHYFHIVDTLETAHSFGIRLSPDLRNLTTLSMQADFDPYEQSDFDAMIASYIPLTLAINSLNRSMGQPDLYPFVLPPPVLEKLRFIHKLLQQFQGRANHAAITPSTTAMQ
jgi:hypothetical protein